MQCSEHFLSACRAVACQRYCTKSGKQNGKENQGDLKISDKDNAETPKPPEEPTTCCMSGCANCVWLEYAEKLSEYYKDGGEKSIKEINEKISDPNIKAYLLHELRMRMKK